MTTLQDRVQTCYRWNISNFNSRFLLVVENFEEFRKEGKT